VLCGVPRVFQSVVFSAFFCTDFLSHAVFFLDRVLCLVADVLVSPQGWKTWDRRFLPGPLGYPLSGAGSPSVLSLSDGPDFLFRFRLQSIGTRFKPDLSLFLAGNRPYAPPFLGYFSYLSSRWFVFL